MVEARVLSKSYFISLPIIIFGEGANLGDDKKIIYNNYRFILLIALLYNALGRQLNK